MSLDHLSSDIMLVLCPRLGGGLLAALTGNLVVGSACVFLAGAAFGAAMLQFLRRRKRAGDPGQAFVRLLQELPVAAVLRKGQNIIMNERAASLLGCPRGRLRTLDQWFAYLYGPRASEMQAAHERDRELGGEGSHTIRVSSSDGIQRSIQMTVQILSGLELWLLEDVSSREQTLGVRRNVHQRMQQCLTNMAAMAFVLDRDGTVMLWEGKAMATLGFKPGEVSGKNALILYRDDMAFAETLRRAVEGEEFTTIVEIRGYAFEVRYTAIRGGSHGILATIGVAIDVTDRRRAERALAESERRYRLIYNNLAEIMVIHQMEWTISGAPSDYRILDCNDSLCRLLGKPREEIVNKLATQVYGVSEAPFLEAYARVVRNGTREHFEGSALGRHFTVDAFSPGTGPDQFATLATDITEVRKTQELLARERQAVVASARAKERLLESLSRELRLPLTPVLALLTGLEHDERVSESLRADLRTMRRAVDEEVALLDHLADAVQVMQRRLALDKEPLSLHDVIASAMPLLAAEFEHRSVRVQTSLVAESAHVCGDARRLGHVVQHLLRNALQFTPPGGSVSVSTRNHGQQVVLEVQDTGAGIDAMSLRYVFEHARPLSSPGEREPGGAGLGLATARAIVELHGGEIAAASPGPGRGSTFTVSLPLMPMPAPGHASVESETPPERKLDVLLVEDDASTLDVLGRLLVNMGHEVTRASQFGEAKSLMASRCFDVLIADVGLPDGSGLELLRSTGARIPRRSVVLSGGAMASDVAASRAAGFQVHLIKPVSYQALREALVE
jgi:PAS domain S-box-containing protein